MAAAPNSLDDIARKLDTIVESLEQMNKRDKLRTVGGFVRNIIALIPIIILVGSTWYFYKHGNEIMQNIIDQSASAAARNSTQTLQQLQTKYGIGVKK